MGNAGNLNLNGFLLKYLKVLLANYVIPYIPTFFFLVLLPELLISKIQSVFLNPSKLRLELNAESQISVQSVSEK